MALPGRSFNAGNSSYKYGFNGKEDDKDISPGGQDYGMRIYDKRVCRFLSVDPITKDYPELTPYQFASDEPLSNIDLDGLEKANATKSKLWGSDYTGFIQNATPEQREEHPIKAFIKDFSADILNVIGPGQVDNNIATLNDKNASTFDKVVAVFDLGFSLEPFKPETEKPETPTKSPTTSEPIIKVKDATSTEISTPSIKKINRTGDQVKLKAIVKDPKASSADKGWIKQDLNQIKRGKRTSIRRPPGKVLAHERGREAAKGYSYKHSHLQTKELHKLQHTYDNNGTSNKERPANK